MPTTQDAGTDRIEKSDKVPSAYRATAFRSNDEGWAAQLENLDRHVRAHPAT